MAVTHNLASKLQQHANAVEMLRASVAGPELVPIRAEFTNWRDEQEAWRTSACSSISRIT